jgi:hypothetical protein
VDGIPRLKPDLMHWLGMPLSFWREHLYPGPSSRGGEVDEFKEASRPDRRTKYSLISIRRGYRRCSPAIVLMIVILMMMMITMMITLRAEGVTRGSCCSQTDDDDHDHDADDGDGDAAAAAGDDGDHHDNGGG